MSTIKLLSSGKAGLLLAVALFTLTGCDPYYGVGYGGGYGYGGFANYGYPVGLMPYVPRTVNSYNYSYYPRYGAYYHHPSQQYHYISGNRWMSGPSLPGYSPRVIQAAHSVPFNFNSHPSNFHNQVSQAFPHNWSPPGGGGGSTYRGGNHGGNGGWGGSYGGHRH